MGLLGLAAEQFDAAGRAEVRRPSRGAIGVASSCLRAPAFSKAARTWRTTLLWSMLPAAATTRWVGS